MKIVCFDKTTCRYVDLYENKPLPSSEDEIYTETLKFCEIDGFCEKLSLEYEGTLIPLYNQTELLFASKLQHIHFKTNLEFSMNVG